REREGIAMSWSSRRGASAATASRPPVRTWRGWRWSVPALLAVAVVVLAACRAGPVGPPGALRPRRAPPPVLGHPPARAAAGQADHAAGMVPAPEEGTKS